MRFSSSLEFNRALTGLINLRAGVEKYQQQVSSGRKVQTASDDPVAASQVLNIGERMSAMEQYNRNANLADLRLSDQELALTSSVNTLQRVRELLLTGRNGSLTPDDRRYLNSEIQQRLQELVGVANTRNANGEYIFSGTQVDTRPFAPDTAGNVAYLGDQTVRELTVAEGRTVAEGFSGQDVFMGVRNGNGVFVSALAGGNAGTGRVINDTVTDRSAWVPQQYTLQFDAVDPTKYTVLDAGGNPVLDANGNAMSGLTYSDGAAISFNGISFAITGTPAAGDSFTIAPSANQSIFSTVQNVVTAMQAVPVTDAQKAQLTFNIDRAIQDLDQSMNKMTELRAAIGGRQNTIEAQVTSNTNTVDQLTKVKSTLEDADPVEAISKLAQYSQLLEAAQASFVKVQNLSLFNYLR